MRIDGITPRHRALLALAMLSTGYVAAFWLVYYVTVRTAPGRRFGDSSLRGALLTNRAVAATVDTVLDVVSAASLFGAIALVAAIALVRLDRLAGVAAVGLALAANATTWLLKATLSRPDLGFDEVTPATLNSMPSGHTTAVFSAVAALMLVLPRPWRRLVALTGSAASVAVALATMSAGWHRAGDSIAAFMVVGFWSALAAAVVVALESPREIAPVSSARIELEDMRWAAVTAVGAAIVGTTLALVLDGAPPLQGSVVDAGVALLAAVLLVGGTAVMTVLGIHIAFALPGSRQRRPGNWA